MSRFDSFDLAPVPWVWPVPRASLKRIGQSVLSDRDGSGRPHFGLDGRRSTEPGKRRAGLWIDILASGFLCRYLHMGQVLLQINQTVKRGALIGFLGENPAGEPHLHFEIRRSDVVNGKYGDAVDPLLLLPKRTQDNV